MNVRPSSALRKVKTHMKWGDGKLELGVVEEPNARCSRCCKEWGSYWIWAKAAFVLMIMFLVFLLILWFIEHYKLGRPF